MIIIIIAISCLALYSLFKTMPDAWEILPELVADGDIIMSICFFSCIAAAILAILVAIFASLDGFAYSLNTFGGVCIISSLINISIQIKNILAQNAPSFVADIIEAIVGTIILQFYFAIPIGFIALSICLLIRLFKN